jgi:diguanylate cyclase (GGDEF)-like protein
MSEEHNFFQFVGPVVFLALAIGFATIRYHAPFRVSAGFFALSFLLRPLAFMADYFRLAMPPDIGVFAPILLFLACGVTFCAGVFHLFSLRVPWWVLGSIVVAVVELFGWYRFVEDSLVMRIVVMNAMSAGVLVWLAIAIRHRIARGVDRLLQVLLVINAGQFVARTAVMLWLEGGTLTADTYAESLTAVSLRFATTVSSLAIAGTLLAIYGVEITERLTRSSETDPLTGILNRRGFEARVAALLDGVAQGGARHGLIIADIDGFKSVNDRCGHDAGDTVIARIARLLEEGAGSEGLVARWGGEEFVVLIPNGGEAMARLYAESVRTAAEAMGHDCLNGEAVTISLGITEWRPGDTLRQACGRADTALYEAKQAGRNCVRAALKPAPLRLVESVA